MRMISDGMGEYPGALSTHTQTHTHTVVEPKLTKKQSRNEDDKQQKKEQNYKVTHIHIGAAKINEIAHSTLQLKVSLK